MTGALIFIILVSLAIAAFYLYCNWRLFQKAGREGWESIIPIYSQYVMLKFVGKPGWWLLLYFIPIVNIIFIIWTYNMLSKSFGKDEGFTVGLLLLGFIFLPVLALGDSRYVGPYGDPAAFQAHQQQFDVEQGRFNA
jgi:hypothetical protein